MKGDKKQISQKCKDMALRLMDDLTWDIDGRVPALLWRAAKRIDELERENGKHPIAWRVRDCADGWIIYQDEDAAKDDARQRGALIQPLYP